MWTNLISQLDLLQLIQQSTRIQDKSESLLDHIYVTKPNNVLHNGINDISLSDHYMIFLVRKLGTKNKVQKPRIKITYFDWKNFCTRSFQNDLRSASWDEKASNNASW